MKKPSPERGWAFLCAARAADGAHLHKLVRAPLMDIASRLLYMLLQYSLHNSTLAGG
jgi:hypothetical protein